MLRVFTLWIWFDGNLEMESKHSLNQNKQILIRNQLPELCSKLQFRFTQISFNFVSTSIDRHRPGAEFNFRLNLLRSVIPTQEFNYTSRGLLINSYLTKIDSLDARDFSNSFSDLSLCRKGYNELWRDCLNRSIERSGWQLSCSLDFSFRPIED